ncbi:aldehyde dehydrogenase family protein [Stenotrophomonas sp. 24(2023)]|uniref:aldehyde dehydrogenase family protein n=1 Tax=Stenotrophomonas sp. 24(2023) TaxID=3068324 RepID=UPI0027DFEF61|nr:aldehyde dehydrogenase family protein [Stenotrophomonas sp. 24(2023)]WMJ69335.1 aldehyde dehydrogenase family protein [Stenotrophomonas sp. 24(2023)]
MRQIEHHYINGAFVASHGRGTADLHNPATEAVIGQVRLGDATDAAAAIAAAHAALPAQAARSVAERLEQLSRYRDAMAARKDALREAIIEEYGAPSARSQWMAEHPVQVIEDAMTVLRQFPFERQVGQARVRLLPVGVAGLITPWNSNASFICGKLATALAAGCTAVVKPSEMSALQTQVVMEALHAAQLPAGVANIVNGLGEDVGAALSASPAIAKISFTGSTGTGRAILRASADTFKRTTLELGGKSPTILLDDADPAQAALLAVQAGFMNSGQACIAGTRILVPESRRAAFEAALTAAVQAVRSGDPTDPQTDVGPMVSARQWQRVQGYIHTGLAEGARLLAGGEGRPQGLPQGWFVRPTLFTDVRNDMTIAREEIFGPVLSIIGYRDDEDAIAIANDTTYGLSALVIGTDRERAGRVARRIQSGRVLVNTLAHEPLAPFGGMKQSGIGRESGAWGLEAFLEPQTVLEG